MGSPGYYPRTTSQTSAIMVWRPFGDGGTQYGVLAAWREPDLGRVIALNIYFYG